MRRTAELLPTDGHASNLCLARPQVTSVRPTGKGVNPVAAQPGRRVKAMAASFALSLPASDHTNSRSASSDKADTVLSSTRKANNDPSASGEDITAIHAPEELAEVLAENPSKLVCLMCKALGCRPCKMFARKYQRVASTYKDCIFLEVTGDETTSLRKMMIQMGVRATPTFRLYREAECVKTCVGIDEEKLRNAVTGCLKADEAGFVEQE